MAHRQTVCPGVTHGVYWLRDSNSEWVLSTIKILKKDNGIFGSELLNKACLMIEQVDERYFSLGKLKLGNHFGAREMAYYALSPGA